MNPYELKTSSLIPYHLLNLTDSNQALFKTALYVHIGFGVFIFEFCFWFSIRFGLSSFHFILYLSDFVITTFQLAIGMYVSCALLSNQ